MQFYITDKGELRVAGRSGVSGCLDVNPETGQIEVISRPQNGMSKPADVPDLLRFLNQKLGLSGK